MGENNGWKIGRKRMRGKREQKMEEKIRRKTHREKVTGEGKKCGRSGVSTLVKLRLQFSHQGLRVSSLQPAISWVFSWMAGIPMIGFESEPKNDMHIDLPEDVLQVSDLRTVPLQVLCFFSRQSGFCSSSNASRWLCHVVTQLTAGQWPCGWAFMSWNVLEFPYMFFPAL